MAEISKEIGLDDAIRGIGMDKGEGALSSDDEKGGSGSEKGLVKDGRAKEVEVVG